jgi:Fe-S-cluster-containing hydrogenase component 2
MDEKTGKATIAYQSDCQNCHICKMYCPVGAVTTNTDMELPPMIGWC